MSLMSESETPKIELRPYQKEAVSAALETLPDVGRGNIVMACGTGKTLVGARIADRLSGSAGDTVLVLAPTLALLDQLYRRWREFSSASFKAMGICSDDDLGEANDRPDTSLGIRTTTDPEHLKTFLLSEATQVRVVFATYQSTPVVSAATLDADHIWTLVVCDEAHRTAGTTEGTFATILRDSAIPSLMRLFLTASPRVHSAETDNTGRGLASMDNEDLYGPRIYTYTFGRGISEGWLSDYRVLILAVSSEDVHRRIKSGQGISFDGRAMAIDRAAAALGFLRAASDYDLRRTIAFHNTITASRQFANDLAFLSRHTQEAPDVDTYHLDGLATSLARRTALQALSHPPGGASVVVNNVRVLGEGVDIPALDGVLFAEPKRSQIEVIQAVGRAIRPNKSRASPSLVVVPVYLAPGENPAVALSGSNFRHVWQVLRALRDHDAALDSELSAIRKNLYDAEQPMYEPSVLPEKIMISTMDGEASQLVDSIRTVVLDEVTTSWAYGLDRFVEYRRTHGSSAVPARYFDERTNFPLGQWVQAQRQSYRWGRLSDNQIWDLEEAGFVWGKRSRQWRNNLQSIQTLRVGLMKDTISSTEVALALPSLTPWLRSVRERHDKGRLTQSEESDLTQALLWKDDPLSEWIPDEIWDETVSAAIRTGLRQKRMNVFGKRVSARWGKELIATLAEWNLVSREDRQRLREEGVTLPPARGDIQLGSEGWEVKAQERITRSKERMEELGEVGTHTERMKEMKRRRSAVRVDSKRVVSITELFGPAPSDWRRKVMNPHHEDRDGLQNVMRELSSLVQAAEDPESCRDEYVALESRQVLRRRVEGGPWNPSGRVKDHLDEVVVAMASGPPTPSDQAVHVGTSSSGRDLDGGALPDPPEELVKEISAEAARRYSPDREELAKLLVRSYGVRRVTVVASAEEAIALAERRRRQRRNVALLPDELADDLTTAMNGVRRETVRLALSKYAPQILSAFARGELAGWPLESAGRS